MAEILESMAVHGPAATLAGRLRALGPVLDMPATAALYANVPELRTKGLLLVPDVPYGDDPQQCVDIYRPAGATGPRPVLLHFHGGGFIRGDKHERANAGRYFAGQGYLTLVANYRLAPGHCWPAGAEDVSRALQWTRQHAAAYGGDARQLFLMGESAGAAHVAAATLIRRFHPAGGLKLAGVVLSAGVYNAELEYRARRQFGTPTPDPRNDAYYGADLARLRERSIAQLIDALPFPLLLSYAELDLPQMQLQAGELFARLVNQHGFAPELAVIPGHNHLSQFFSINTGDESLSAPVLRFLRANTAH
jgi:triacylglycerol lipase